MASMYFQVDRFTSAKLKTHFLFERLFCLKALRIVVKRDKVQSSDTAVNSLGL